MKSLKSFLLFFCIVSSAESLSAQTQKFVEVNLGKSYDKITYWCSRRTDPTVNAYDSVKKANEVFGELLKYYTAKYPLTIKEELKGMKKPGFYFFGNGDNTIRIYSWDTWLGKTTRGYDNVFQYVVNNKSHSELEIDTGDNSCHLYSRVNTCLIKGKTYYLAVYNSFYRTKRATQGVQIFAIAHGKLNKDVDLIKTDSEPTSQLSYDYNYGTYDLSDFQSRPTIHFNGYTNTIYIPVVENDLQIPNKFITYKFTGQYFEKVK